MTQSREMSLDDACAYLVAFADAHGLEGIQLDANRDGRVYLYARKAAYPHHTAWTVLADTHPGGAFPTPSRALDAQFTADGRASMRGSKVNP